MHRISKAHVAAASAAVLLMVSSMLAPLASAQAGDAMTTREWFEQMDARYARYDAWPAAPREKGDGYPAYMRYKWFAEPRLSPETGNQIPGARWEAWQELKQLEAQYGTRSETWFTNGPINVAGRVLAIAIHPTNPDIVYAGFASGGIWKTTNGGDTWTPLGDDLPTLSVSAIKLDVNNPNRIWMGTGEGWGNIDAVHGVGVLFSEDAGESWSLTGFNYEMSSGLDVFSVEHNPATGTLLVGADNGLWRSTDDGATFTQVMSIGTYRDIEMKKGSSNIVFAVAHQGALGYFYRSFDDGATWTQITNGTPTSGITNSKFALCDADPELILWALSGVGGQQYGIWRSTDGGDSFSQILGNGGHYGSQGWYNISLAIDPTDPNRVFSGGVNYYRSTNGGSSFSQYANNVHVDHHAAAFAPSDPTQFWVGSDGGVWRSTNAGLSFADRNAGLVTMQFYAINQSQSQPTLAMGGTQDNGTYIYNNSLNWSYGLGGDGFFCEIHRSNTDILYAEVYNGTHYRSVNGGGVFYPKNNGITEQGPWSTPTHMDYSNSSILWTAHTTKVFKTVNDANSWSWVGNPTGLGGGRSIAQSRSDHDIVAVIGPTRIFLTPDAGTTWVERTSGIVSGGSLSDIAIDPVNPDIMVVTCTSYSDNFPHVYKTVDQGQSWFGIDDGLPVEPVNTIEIDPLNPDWYFIGTDTAVYVSFDAGASWQPFNTGLPHVVMADLRLHEEARILRVGTHGRGMWEVDISELTGFSEAEEVRPAVEPVTIRLLGNPAASNTIVRYGIREPGHVKVGLYDLQGRLVRTLVDRFEYAIMSSVEVDVSDLENGVYFARIDANGAQMSRKLTIQR